MPRKKKVLKFERHKYVKKRGGKERYCVIGALMKSHRIPFGDLGLMKNKIGSSVWSVRMYNAITSLIGKSGLSVDDLGTMQDNNDSQEWKDLRDLLVGHGIYKRLVKYSKGWKKATT